MNRKDMMKMLAAHRRWLNNRGRKYLPPEVPVKDISEAIDFVVDALAHDMSEDAFRTAYSIVERFCSKKKEERAALRQMRKVIRWMNCRAIGKETA